MAEFHDVSTKGGFLKRIWFRWKTTLMVVFIGVVILFLLSHVIQTYVLQSPTPSLAIPSSTFVISGSKLMYHGDEAKFDTRYFDPFPDLPIPSEISNIPIISNDTTSASSSVTPVIDTIEIKWVRLSGSNFTTQLSQYASTLRFLRLDNVTLEDHFQPVSLPLLEEFYLNQGAQPEEKNSPDYILNNGPTPWLTSTLFFVEDNSTNFANKAVLAYKRPINVTVFLKGSIAYQLNPGYNEVRLDISDCNEVLTKLPQTYKILTLGRCKDLTPKSIHAGVTFLNFYIVYVSNELLSAILKNIPALEELYAEIPDGPIDIRLQDLSPKLRILSVSSMSIIPGKGGSYPNIKEFYFGQENQYGWLPSRITTLNESIFLHFGKIFPKVEKVGLFDVKDEERYIFLRSVLQTPSVKWILVENFGRVGGNDNSNLTGLDKVGVNGDAYLFVENTLDTLGLSRDVVDFVVEIDPTTGRRRARGITPLEKLWYRFTYLGWCPIDSWPKFLYVEKIIADGGILGQYRNKGNATTKTK